VPFEFIDKVFAVMQFAPQHSYQILTKRPHRMAEYLNDIDRRDKIADAAYDLDYDLLNSLKHNVCVDWPHPNIWLGTSCENQQTADERIHYLLNCPAALHFLSCEPLLSPIDLRFAPIDWVIAGGESGHNARPMHPDWVRSLRNQCQVADVPFFFKQWGAWIPAAQVHTCNSDNPTKGKWIKKYDFSFFNVGKKAAGNLLDGKKHEEFPALKELAHA
ncbi:DUF5131 family protein, partial [Bacteroidales bacterium AH-315-I05]|nr:DUF5131 family protein [Bacteroidales bacterium AH-315-I05]